MHRDLPPPPRRFAVALASVTLIGPLAIHLFLPAMPAVKEAFAGSSALVEATFSVTLVTMGAVTLVYGSLSDRYGRRPLLLTSLALFLAGSLFSAFAVSIGMLIFGRLVQALGAGGSLTLTRAMARDAYGADRLVQAIGYLTMAYTLGPMIAPPIGGVLIDHFGWRAIFWFAIVVGGTISAASYVILRETRRVETAPPHGMFGAYLALLGEPRFLAYVLQSGFCSGTFFAIAAASPFLMTGPLGRSATEFGLYFFLFPLGYGLGNLTSSRLSGRVSIETMVLTGSVLSAVVMGVQAALVLAGIFSPAVIFVPGGVITYAQGLALPNAQAGAIQVLPRLAGTAAGIGVCVQLLLMAGFVQLYGAVADGTPLPMIAVAGAAAVLTVAAGAVPYALRRR